MPNCANTVDRLVDAIHDTRQLAVALLGGSTPAYESAEEVTTLTRELGWIREALAHHLADREPDPGEYDYLVAASYTAETSVRVAAGISEVDSTGAIGDREVLWRRIQNEEFRVAREVIGEAWQHLWQVRKHLGSVGLAIRLIKLRRAARRHAKAAAAMLPDSRQPTHGVASARATRKGRATPLGFGDLKFKLFTSASAITQFRAASELPVLLLEPADAELPDGPGQSLRAAEEYLLRLFHEPTRQSMPSAVLSECVISLVKAETALVQSRLSRASTLNQSKIFLLRAVAYLSHHWKSQRYIEANGDWGGDVHCGLRLAGWCIRRARSLHRQSDSLWWHDRRWRIAGADLSSRLGPFEVLQQYRPDDLSMFIEVVSHRILAAREEAHGP